MSLDLSIRTIDDCCSLAADVYDGWFGATTVGTHPASFRSFSHLAMFKGWQGPSQKGFSLSLLSPIMNSSSGSLPLRIAIGSLGTIGQAVARRLDAGIDGLILSAVSAKNHARAFERIQRFQSQVPVLSLSIGQCC